MNLKEIKLLKIPNEVISTLIIFVYFAILTKADNDKKNFERLTDAIKDSRKGKTMGVFTKDAKLSGAFLVFLTCFRLHVK